MNRHCTAVAPSPCRELGLLQWGLVGLLLSAWALRLPLVLETPLHPDEALYGYWGLLIGRGRDLWLTSSTVYKPPLLPYLVSAFQLVFGNTTLALRLTGLLAGLLTVPLVGALARTLYGDLWTGAAAMVAVALSSFAVAFSGTAFPDPVMVALGLGGCLAAARRHWRCAGLLAGLSFATKQTGLAWLPLVLGIALAQGVRPARQLPGFVILWVSPAILAFVWDGVRVALGADSFWSAGIVGYGGLRLIWPHELWPRFEAWAGLMGSLFESPVVNAFLLLGLAFLFWRALFRDPRTRCAFFDQLLISFCLFYLLLHWLVAFPTWGRYLLPLVPILAVLLGRVTREVVDLWSTRLKRSPRPALSAMLLALFLVAPAYEARAGRSPVAEAQTAYRGAEDVISFLSEMPEGSVVYHHWLGWHYHYALFDTAVYLAYWPTPTWLAQDVQAFGTREPRYVAFPGWESPARVARALNDVGYALEPLLTVTGNGGDPSFVVYRIVPTPVR